LILTDNDVNLKPKNTDDLKVIKFFRSGSLTLGKHSSSKARGDATLLITQSTNNLAQRGFDNTMTRYKIDGNELWLFYDKPNFEDLLFTATGPVDWTGVSVINNDKVSSVRRVRGEWSM
jgi:hypothetical protein